MRIERNRHENFISIFKNGLNQQNLISMHLKTNTNDIKFRTMLIDKTAAKI